MPQFDVHRDTSGPDYLLNCQSDLLSGLNTRLVVPLMTLPRAPIAGQRLNPVFAIDDTPHAMVTQFAGAMPVRALGPAVANLAQQRDRIIAALDTLLTGV